MLKPHLEKGDVWNPEERKQTTVFRPEDFLEDPDIDRDKWEADESPVRPVQHNVRARRFELGRGQAADDLPNLEKVFHEEVAPVLKPNWIPAEVPPKNNRPEAPLAFNKPPFKQTV